MYLYTVCGNTDCSSSSCLLPDTQVYLHSGIANDSCNEQVVCQMCLHEPKQVQTHIHVPHPEEPVCGSRSFVYDTFMGIARA